MMANDVIDSTYTTCLYSSINHVLVFVCSQLSRFQLHC